MPVRLETALEPGHETLSTEVSVHAVPQQAPAGAGLPESVTAQAPLPGAITLHLQEGIVWRIESEAEGLWSEPRWLAPGPGNPSPSETIRFFRSAVVEGRAEGKPNANMVELRFSSVPGNRARLSRVLVDCPIQEGRFRCTVPAGSWDLRLRSEGSIPVYRWSVEASPERAADLGVVRFRDGSSVVGWVKLESDKLPTSDCRVKLVPLTYGATADPALQALAKEVQANERGFFQIEVAEAGFYEISAAQPGFAPARLQPIEVRPDLETEIRVPLVLTPPSSVRLELDPPHDPAGNAWGIHLQRFDKATRVPAELYRGTASAEGVWEQRDVAPGEYMLLVLGALETRWVHQTLEIGPGMSSVRIDVPVLRVRGRVSLGDEPLAGANLWFGGRFGPRNAHFQSGDDGEFEGVLPEEGTWKVDLVSDEVKLRLPLKPVEVRKRPGQSFAWVEIVLPDTRLHGEVVDEKGQPLPQATVSLLGMEIRPGVRVRTDREGKFEVRGLPPGGIVARAESGNRTSDPVTVQVTEDADAPPLRLVAREVMTVQGQVLSARGPVAGARIQVWPSLDQVDAATLQETVSAKDGGFSLSFPAGTRSVDVAVAAPGHALRLYRTPLYPDRPLDIHLEPFGGTLVLDLGDQPADGVLVHEGAFIHFPLLARWSQIQGGKREGNVLTLPSVEAGDYWYCPGNTGIAALRQGQPVPTGSCVGGSLAALSELVLKGDEAKPESPSKGTH